MQPQEQLQKVSQGVTNLHARFVEQMNGVQDEGMRKYMTALAARLQEVHADVMQAFPKAYAAIQTQIAATQKQNVAILQQIESAKAKQSEAVAKAAAAAKARAGAAAQVGAQIKTQAATIDAKPKEPTLPPMSAQLSDALRDELLQRFGLKEAPRRKPAEFQEAGEDWHGSKPVQQSVILPAEWLAR